MLRFGVRVLSRLWRYIDPVDTPARLPIVVLLVVVSAGSVPVGSAYIRSTRDDQCRVNFRRLSQALYSYNEANGHLPAAAIVTKDKRPLLSWRVAILPRLGYADLYARFHLDEPWDSEHNLALLEEMPLEYSCPSNPRTLGRTTYKGIVGAQGMFELARGIDIREVLDGTSNTIIVGEGGPAVPWTKPEDFNLVDGGSPVVFSSRHSLGFTIAFADGSARFLRHGMSPTILRALLTRDGGEVVGDS